MSLAPHLLRAFNQAGGRSAPPGLVAHPFRVRNRNTVFSGKPYYGFSTWPSKGGRSPSLALKAWTTLRVAHPTASPPSWLNMTLGEWTLGGREGASGKPRPSLARWPGGSFPLRTRRSVGRSLHGPAGRPGAPQEARSWVLATHPPPGRASSLSGPILGVLALSAAAAAPRAGNLVLPTVAPGRRAEVRAGGSQGVLPIGLVAG